MIKLFIQWNILKRFKKNTNVIPGLIERSLYAFGLLEALRTVGIPFCFKGGTSLMLLLDTPARLSTDIDILVEPGTDIGHYIEMASAIFPFVSKTEDIRKRRGNLIKRHFKFFYYSPVQSKLFYILLDVVYSHIPYAQTIEKEIKNDLLLTYGDNATVQIPTADCLLGEKLTAFAPHTTGVPIHNGKQLEIAKQLFDIGLLFDYIEDYALVKITYETSAEHEITFRGQNWDKSDVLKDTIHTCLCIIAKGSVDKDEFFSYLRGIKSLKNHILLSGYNFEDAVWKACKILYLSSCLLSGIPFTEIKNPQKYRNVLLEKKRYKSLAYIRKQRLLEYAYLVEGLRNLNTLDMEKTDF